MARRKSVALQETNSDDLERVESLEEDDYLADVGDVKEVEYGSPERPLKLGDLEIPCFVLEGGIRVLYRAGLLNALGMTEGSATAGRSGDRLEKFVQGSRISEFVSEELLDKASNSIRFRYGGKVFVGYEATILADICEAVLAAKSAGKLQKQQAHIALRCEILIRGFARVGIVALVDEATNYQDHRVKDALAEILRHFISEELVAWAKMFPDEYYKELFRLRGLSYDQFNNKRPMYIGKITKNIIYDRLAPGVSEALEEKNPKNEKGRRKVQHFRWLTKEEGQQKLREHLASVVVLMRASSNWAMFQKLLERSLPRWDVQRMLPGLEHAGLEDD